MAAVGVWIMQGPVWGLPLVWPCRHPGPPGPPPLCCARPRTARRPRSPMRDGNQTGYAPKPIEGVTPMQRVEVEDTSIPCDGQIGVGGLGHPRIWLRISVDQGEIT